MEVARRYKLLVHSTVQYTLFTLFSKQCIQCLHCLNTVYLTLAYTDLTVAYMPIYIVMEG